MQFHLEQAKARTQQRLGEGRPKPIDVIVRNLYFPDDVDADAADPYEVAKSLTLPELLELADDVQDYQVLTGKYVAIPITPLLLPIRAVSA